MNAAGQSAADGKPLARLVAANMRKYRLRRGWTQDELGERLGGWSRVVVSAAERSDESPSRVRTFQIDEVGLIADVLGVGIMDLLTPIPPCPCCGDKPPAGMTCQECKAKGPVFSPPAGPRPSSSAAG